MITHSVTSTTITKKTTTPASYITATLPLVAAPINVGSLLSSNLGSLFYKRFGGFISGLTARCAPIGVVWRCSRWWVGIADWGRLGVCIYLERQGERKSLTEEEVGA